MTQPAYRVIQRRADDLKDGDVVVARVSLDCPTATGYIQVWLGGQLRCVPPDTLFDILD